MNRSFESSGNFCRILSVFIENNKQAIKQYQDSLERLVSKGQEKYLKLMKALSKLGISM